MGGLLAHFLTVVYGFVIATQGPSAGILQLGPAVAVRHSERSRSFCELELPAQVREHDCQRFA